jgi:hypothetical protein
MKAAIITLVLSTTVLGAQALPDAPKPSNKLDRTLILLDFGARTADLVSTRNFLNNPCKCIHEVDPIAPHTASLGPQLAFQYGMFGLVTGGSQLLRKHHHTKLATALLMWDIGDEVYAVQSNVRVNNDHGIAPVVGRVVKH